MSITLTTSTWGKEEIQAINDVVASGRFSMGDKVAEFERQFAKYFGSRYAVMVNSGSSANLLMIAALACSGKINRGDEVIVPAVSWATTYAPLQQYGLRVKFVDTDVETLNFNIEALKNAVNDDTKVIFCVNILGNPNDFNEVKKIIGKRDIILIEDNCESMGAMYRGKYAGTIGLMGSFSMFFSHHISTMEGGMVVTDDEKMYHYLLSLRSHGWTRHLPDKNHVSNKSDDDFTEMFRFVLPGYNLRPLEMSGAIGIEQLKKLPDLLDKRRINVGNFQRVMWGHPAITQKQIGLSSWFGFSMIFSDRMKAMRAFRKYNIEYRPVVAGDFTRNEVIQYFDCDVAYYAGAQVINDHGLYIGNHGEYIDFSPLKMALDEI